MLVKEGSLSLMMLGFFSVTFRLQSGLSAAHDGKQKKEKNKTLKVDGEQLVSQIQLGTIVPPNSGDKLFILI